MQTVDSTTNHQIAEIVEAIWIPTPMTQCCFITLFSSIQLLASCLNYSQVHPRCCKIGSRLETKYKQH